MSAIPTYLESVYIFSSNWSGFPKTNFDHEKMDIKACCTHQTNTTLSRSRSSSGRSKSYSSGRSKSYNFLTSNNEQNHSHFIPGITCCLSCKYSNVYCSNHSGCDNLYIYLSLICRFWLPKSWLCSSHKCFHNHHCCSFNCTTRGCVCLPDGGECRVDAACCSKMCKKESKWDKFGICEQPGQEKKETTTEEGETTSTTAEATPGEETTSTTAEATPGEATDAPSSNPETASTTTVTPTDVTEDGEVTVSTAVSSLADETEGTSTTVESEETTEITTTANPETTEKNDVRFRVQMWPQVMRWSKTNYFNLPNNKRSQIGYKGRN